MTAWEGQYHRMKRAHGRLAAPPDYASDDLDSLRAAFHEHVDNLIGFFQHAWHLKDWIRNDNEIPEALRRAAVQDAERSPALQLCADIANGSKHLMLNNSRVDARLSLVEFLRTKTPGRHTIEVFIDASGNKRVYARQAAQEVVDAWEGLLRRHGLTTGRAA